MAGGGVKAAPAVVRGAWVGQKPHRGGGLALRPDIDDGATITAS